MSYCYIDDEYFFCDEMTAFAKSLGRPEHTGLTVVIFLAQRLAELGCKGPVDYAMFCKAFEGGTFRFPLGPTLASDPERIWEAMSDSGLLTHDGSEWRLPAWIRFDVEALEAEEPDVKNAAPLFPWALGS